MHGVIDAITSLPPLAAYAIIAALVFGEAAIFIGFVFPGETAVLLGGFLASQHHLSVVTLCILVFVSAVVGDTVGFEVGKHFGPRIMRLRLFTRHQDRLDSASDLLRRRGGPAVFLGRFTAFFRAVMPGLAGLSQMRYRTFLAWNAFGGLIWGVGFTLVGYFAGASYDKVASQIGRGTAIALGVLVVAVLIGWHLRRRRAARKEDDKANPDGPPTPARII
ncbi:MAG: DedA family protein [Nocardioidaceae bacterium]